MEEKYVGYCYDSLLPRAGSFNGSRLRVVGAAVEVLVANFRSLLAELRRLKSTSGGGGGAAYKLGECIDLAEVMSGEAGKEEPEKLARIRSLAASGDDGAVNDLLDIDLWLSEFVGERLDRCETDVEKIPNVETLLPTMALMDPAMETCFGLVIGFPQPPEE
jgi:hypothetical protein